MYDTVNFFLDVADMGTTNPYSCVQYLSDTTDAHSKKRGKYTSGYIMGYKVYVSSAGISMQGSLAQHWFDGNNLYTLDRHAAKQAIESLSDALHIDMGAAKVHRIDFSTNFSMLHTPKYYFSLLGDKGRFKRTILDTTLYYKTKQIVLTFYDKKAQLKAKLKSRTNEYLKGLEDVNLLRYEMCLKGGNKAISNKLSVDSVVLADLYTEPIYNRMVELWCDQYNLIQKRDIITVGAVDLHPIKTVSNAKNHILGILLHEAGPERVDTLLKDIERSKAMSGASGRRRLRKQLNEARSMPSIAQSNVIVELDDQIAQAGESALAA